MDISFLFIPAFYLACCLFFAQLNYFHFPSSGETSIDCSDILLKGRRCWAEISAAAGNSVLLCPAADCSQQVISVQVSVFRPVGICDYQRSWESWVCSVLIREGEEVREGLTAVFNRLMGGYRQDWARLCLEVGGGKRGNEQNLQQGKFWFGRKKRFAPWGLSDTGTGCLASLRGSPLTETVKTPLHKPLSNLIWVCPLWAEGWTTQPSESLPAEMILWVSPYNFPCVYSGSNDQSCFSRYKREESKISFQ